jgi:heme-degrading monooxygenase HmoA
MARVKSARLPPAHVPQDRPVEIVEEVRLPCLGETAETDWQDLLRAMARRPGCLGLQCRRTLAGYRLHSRWNDWRDFAEWTRATIYLAVAAGLDGRRVAVRALVRAGGAA